MFVVYWKSFMKEDEDNCSFLDKLIKIFCLFRWFIARSIFSSTSTKNMAHDLNLGLDKRGQTTWKRTLLP